MVPLLVYSNLEFFFLERFLCHFREHLCYLALAEDTLAVAAFAFVLPIIDHIFCGQFCCTGSQSYSCQGQISRIVNDDLEKAKAEALQVITEFLSE